MANLSLPPIPGHIRPLRDAQRKAMAGRYTAYSPSNCVTCRGQRTFLWKDPVTGDPATYDCPCADQFLLYEWLCHCGIPANYQRLGWADVIDVTPKVLGGLGEYFDHRNAFIRAGFGVILHGEARGTGKTMLAMLLLKQLIADGIEVYATTFSAMVEAFSQGWQDREQSRWFDTTVRNAPVLYLDDLGREYKGKEQRMKGIDSVGERMLEEVVRQRVSRDQPTMLTTNLSRDDIFAGYGGHTTSLLSECSKFIEVTGMDRRDEVNERRTREIMQGLTRPVTLS